MKKMEDHTIESGSSKYRDIIIQKTLGEIRTFLDELANGTSNYKSLHNLTEQVEHQYHGRFLIELIQNAHDALFPINRPNKNDNALKDEGRIEIVVSDEQPFGALYVANDGSPFTPSNFHTLSRFGQSDKDPEKHIGNKGIGFRSVLEITREPEIYSRKAKSSEGFTGFTFRFNPKIIQAFVTPIRELLSGNNNPYLTLLNNIPLVDWGDGKLIDFRQRWKVQGIEGVLAELKFLSPYLLPEPIGPQIKHKRVQQFEQKGFSTVVRLPIISEKAMSLVIGKVQELDENTAIFLNKAKSLWIDTPDTDRYIARESKTLTGFGGGQKVNIGALDEENSDLNRKTYWVWEWTIGGKGQPEESEQIGKAVEKLPGKWPKVRRADIALAIGVGKIPETGMISIFLPTEQPSGAACFLNAPFYGDISRTFVDLDQPFNSLVFQKLAEKASHIIVNHLAGKGIQEARAILDILCPINHQKSDNKYWIKLIDDAFVGKGITINKEALMLTIDGWKSIEEARLLPESTKLTCITDDLFYENALYPVIDRNLFHRKYQLQNLYEYFGKPYAPESERVAETIETIAIYLREKREAVDWNNFWQDVMRLLPQNSARYLHGKKVLLGTDNQLHVSDDKMSVFFRPRSSGDDEEVLSDRNVYDIPEGLRSHIAFLSEAVTVHVPRDGGGLQNHPLHGYLTASSLVQIFGVESILRTVLIPAIPDLPISLNGQNALLCQAIINWGLRLVESLVAKEKGEKTLRYLGRLPAPCCGGWYPLNQTCFGSGWSGTVEHELQSYLSAADTYEARETAKRLLLPPTNENWGGDINADLELFQRAGVSDGIRLFKIDPDLWDSHFDVYGNRNRIELPEISPPGIEMAVWDKYRDYTHNRIEAKYQGPFEYGVGEIFIFPGMEKFSTLNVDIQEHLMTVLLRSINKWNVGWKHIKISKMEGQSHSINHESPLFFWLKENPWLIDKGNKSPRFRPRDRWFVPQTTILRQAHQFRHLNPIPSNIAWILENNPVLYEQLEELGMPKYRPDVKTSSTRLLNDLAKSLDSPDDITNWNIFLGQIRTAWTLFSPKQDGDFPEQLIVKRGSELKAIIPSKENPIFIPDSESSFHHGLEKQVENVLAAIEPKDAKRLEDGFKRSYGEGVRLISELRVQPLVDGNPWKEVSGTELFRESELAWMIPVLLSCHAYAGFYARGPNTKAFSDAMATLRSAKLFWADRLEMGIWEDDRCHPATTIYGVWVTKSSTLLAANSAREKLSLLAEAFSAIIDRADLEVPLRLVCNKFDCINEPPKEIIEEALQDLKIKSDHFEEIESIQLGDLAWFMRLLRPLLIILDPQADISGLTEVRSKDGLIDYLSKFDLNPLNKEQVFFLLKNANRFFDFGQAMFQKFGDQFQLDKWNKAMAKVGELPLRNKNTLEQFRYNIDTVKVALRSIIRNILRNNKGLGTYTELVDQLESISSSEDWCYKYWEVNFQITMKKIKPFFVSWGASKEVIDALEASKNGDDLILQLDALNLEPDINPLEIYSNNRELCLDAVEIIQKAGIVWCHRSDISSKFWDREPIDFLEYFDAPLEAEGYLDIFSELKILSIFQIIPHDVNLDPFFEILTKSNTIDYFLRSAHIDTKDIQDVKKRLEEIKNRAEKQKRIVNVCGKGFDNTEENLSWLFHHIESEIDVDDLPDVSLTEMARLKEIKDKNRKKSGSPPRKRNPKPKGRMTQALKNLVGFAGEIHAYRILRKRYGAGVVNPSSWLSENSLYKFPNNEVSDDFGCDFEIIYDKKTYYIEVKATQGDEEFFELGSSEIKRAIETAGKRKEKYIIFLLWKHYQIIQRFKYYQTHMTINIKNRTKFLMPD